jgi:hypothetical protein
MIDVHESEEDRPPATSSLLGHFAIINASSKLVGNFAKIASDLMINGRRRIVTSLVATDGTRLPGRSITLSLNSLHILTKEADFLQQGDMDLDEIIRERFPEYLPMRAKCARSVQQAGASAVNENADEEDAEPR